MPPSSDAQPTTDNPIGHDVDQEARDVLEVLDGGGIAIIPLNVAYAILARTEAAIRRIFEVKKRSYDKPSGMFGCAAASADLRRDGPTNRLAYVFEQPPAPER